MLNVEKDFLSNVDYLKALVKEVTSKSISDFDSNLVYEVTYADMYVTDVLSKVKNPRLASNINDIKTSLDLIISAIPDSDVLEARSNSDYTKILKAKYNSLDDGSFEEEVAYTDIDDSSLIHKYLNARMPTIILLNTIMLVMLSGGASGFLNIVSSLINNLTGVVPSSSFIQTESVFIRVADTIISLCLSLSMMVFGVTLAVDLMYLMLPYLRDTLDKMGFTDRMVSIYAKSAIEEVDGKLISYRKIRSFDRIKRNKYWLQSMIDTLTSLQQSGEDVDVAFAKSLVDLQASLESCRERSKEWYTLIAKIEFMHDKYIKLVLKKDEEVA